MDGERRSAQATRQGIEQGNGQETAAGGDERVSASPVGTLAAEHGAAPAGRLSAPDPDWYKDRVFYQIWPRSFKDGNADGVGDLWGVIQSLDYLESLGVGGLWLSPFNASPNADFGYDVSDYLAVNPEYGDEEVLRALFDECRRRDIRVLVDLVVNHTSVEHAWFKASRARPDGPCGDYYIWRPPRGLDPATGQPLPPNNWESIFGGGAWEYDALRGEFYLHVFSRDQPDLNMANPAVRDELRRVMLRWLDRGASGFRLDAANCIAKAPGLPDDPDPGAPIKGISLYKDVPAMYGYLDELRRAVVERDPGAIFVGEVAEATTATALEHASGPGRTFDMLFTFEHMGADCGRDDFDPRPFDLRKLKGSMSRWQTELAGRAWNALYLENHDHPRSVSRFGCDDDPELWRRSACSLACAMLFLQGTPFIYQGEEIGMTNLGLPSIGDYRDVQTLGRYAQLVREMPPEEAMRVVRRGSRESARSPMQWAPGANAGFSSREDGSPAPEAVPWSAVNPDHDRVNVEAEEADPRSPLAFWRRAVRLRRGLDAVRRGAYRELCLESERLWAYERVLGDAPQGQGQGQAGPEADSEAAAPAGQPSRLLVVCSLSREPERFEVPEGWRAAVAGTAPLLADCDDAPVEAGGAGFEARPYECRVYAAD